MVSKTDYLYRLTFLFLLPSLTPLSPLLVYRLVTGVHKEIAKYDVVGGVEAVELISEEMYVRGDCRGGGVFVPLYPPTPRSLPKPRSQSKPPPTPPKCSDHP